MFDMMSSDLPTGPKSLARGRAFADGPKRVFDVFASTVLLVCTAPIILAFACMQWARLQPAFYGHRRLGRDGALFRCWKLRTMDMNGDAILRAHLAADPAARAEWDRTFKLRDDPRVTRLGRFLRASSLDELPQLWNVLRGDMSLVGPRPITAAEMGKFDSAPWAYRTLRPGMTGLWQVASRSGTAHEDRLRFDVEYAQTVSLACDLRVLARTVRAVLRYAGY